MRITLFEIEDWERETFKALEDQHRLVYLKQPLTASNAAEQQDAEIISTFICSKLSSDVLEQLPKLKRIATRKGDFTAEGLRGFDLRGKTLGVIDTGNTEQTP